MDEDFQVTVQRYGPTVHVALRGELDFDTRRALHDVKAAPDESVVVLVCDMARLTFCDATGLHALLDLARRLQGRGIAFFAYNWQSQPRRLLDLVDSLSPSAGDATGAGTDPTRPLRRTLADAAASGRAAGARTARTRDGARVPTAMTPSGTTPGVAGQPPRAGSTFSR